MKLETALQTPCRARVTAGFDGYIDTIVRAVRRKDADGTIDYFTSIADFGGYIASKAGKSAGLEMRVQSEKAGGNLPIFAHALSRLGAAVDCVGALGWPQVHPLFAPLEKEGVCRLHTVCPPGLCQAVEFDDGKLMLARNEEIENLNADLLLSRLPDAPRLFAQAEVKALLNWSEVLGETSIWRALLPHLKGQVFVDLSDCSLRSRAEKQELLSLLCQISHGASLTLSLNRNEAEQLGQAMEAQPGDAVSVCRRLQREMPEATLVLHLTDGAHGFAPGEECFVKNLHVEHPLLSTGGGDNFNAGYVFGLVQGLHLQDRLLLGNRVSGWYVSHGASPTARELATAFLQSM